MSRVKGCPQSIPLPVLLLEPQSQPQCSGKALPHRSRTSERATELLQQLRGKASSGAGADRASAEAQRRKTIIKMVAETAYKLAGLGIEMANSSTAAGLALGTAQIAFDTVNVVAQPLNAIWSLLSGLSRIGNVHLEAQAAGEKRALRRGFAETLGRALDQPRLRGGALLELAARSKHVDHFSTLSKLTTVRKSERDNYNALATEYMEGARMALDLLCQLSADDRRALAVKVAKELDGNDSVDRLVSLFGLQPN